MASKTFQIQQKLFSIGRKYTINDEQGNLVYRAEGKSFSFSQQTKVYDSFDDEIFEIRKRIFRGKLPFLY